LTILLSCTRSFLHSSRSLHICHLGRQHQCTAIVAPVKVNQHLRGFGGLVFLDEVTCFGKDLKLIFACEKKLKN
jgi:hypothetical protein